MKNHGWILSFVLMFFLTSHSFANNYSHFYIIKPELKAESQVENEVANWDPLLGLFGPSLSELENFQELVVRLLNFERVDQSWGRPKVPYKRDRDFGGWIRWAGTGSCLNTRGHVLVRDSLGPVRYDGRGCLVEEGQWWDPYTDRQVSAPRDLQIDHFVPLKNAYVSGAEDWSRVDRCVYANFLGAQYHLIPVWGPENGAKSDKTIADYLPPNDRYRCQYVAQWLKIKLAWQLKLNPYEVATAQAMIRNKECNEADFVMTARELDQVKLKVEETRAYCRR